MRAGIRQSDDAGLVLDQRLHAVIDRIEEAADKAGIKIFIEADLKHRIERLLLPLAGDLGNCAVGQPGMFRLDWRGDDDPLPVTLEHRARPRGPQIGAKTVAEASIAE